MIGMSLFASKPNVIKSDEEDSLKKNTKKWATCRQMTTNKASSTTGSPIKLLKHYSKLHKAFMMAKRDSLKDRALQLCSCMINSTASFPGIQILFISETTLPTVQVS